MGYKNSLIITAPEAARRLGVTNCVVYALIREGELKATNVCNGSKYNRYEIREDEFEKFQAGYRKHKYRKTNKIVKIDKKRPKAVLKPEKKKYTKEETRAEIGKLKEELFNILVKIEELENNI